MLSDEVYGFFEGLGINFQRLKALDDQIGGGSPLVTPSLMIIERDNPFRRGNTQDSSSGNQS